jgi:type IV pilus assembly protein PilA
MTTKLRVRAQSESGFTLVELLVVMLIIGLLAAIAIPAFFNQRNKANDSSAKEAVRTAQTAIETYSTDNGGGYANADVAKLQAIEATIPAACGTATGTQCTSAITPNGTVGYTVSIRSKTGNIYSITRNGGTFSYPCSKPSSSADSGGCTTASGSSTGTWN